MNLLAIAVDMIKSVLQVRKLDYIMRKAAVATRECISVYALRGRGGRGREQA